MFKESDIEWLKVIGCMKKAGMSIKDIKEYIELAMKGDDTIDARLAMFQRQKSVIENQMKELKHTLQVVEYKCWFYETAKSLGSVAAVQKLSLSQVPDCFSSIREELHRTE